MGIIGPSPGETPRNALAGAARTRPTGREEGGPPPLAVPCFCMGRPPINPYPSPAFFGLDGHLRGDDVVVGGSGTRPCTLAPGGFTYKYRVCGLQFSLQHFIVGRVHRRREEVGWMPRKRPAGGGGKYKSRKTGKFVSSYYGKRNPSKVKKFDECVIQMGRIGGYIGEGKN